MITPSVPADVWLLAAIDPLLVAVALVLGWKADQFGKVAIAVIAALGASMLGGFLVTQAGLPWLSPVGRDYPTLMPVRTVAAALWASAGYVAGRFYRSRA